MNYHLEIEKNEDYLKFTVTGKRSIESVVHLTREILGACVKAGIKKALVDVRGMEGQISTLEAYQLSDTHFPTIEDHTKVQKIVVIDHKENEPRYRFLETAAVNRGFPIEYCNDLQQGLKILNKDSV